MSPDPGDGAEGADGFGFAIAPDIGREDALVAFVDEVADGLADEVVGNRVTGEAVVGKQFPFFLHIGLAGGSGIDIEVIAPAGEFEAVVAHFIGKRREFFEREIGPLAGEQRDVA